MEQKNVLYISYDGMTDPLGQSQVIPYLIGLTKYGYNFTILSCEKKGNYIKNREIIQQLLEAKNISWNPIFYTKNPPVISTIYDYYKLRRATLQLHKKWNFKIVHCRSYISSMVGLWMSKKYNVPFIFDMRGFWADERVDGGLWNLNNPVFKFVYRFFKRKELEFLNQSAAVVSLTHAGKSEILTWKGISFGADKITVIPCCVDIDLFNPDKISLENKNTIKESLAIKNTDFIIGYLGSIGTWYMLDEILQFFSELKRDKKNAKLLFVTHDDSATILSNALRIGLDTNDIIITKAGRKDVPAMISIFDYGLFFIKPSFSKIASSPTKQGEIMALGIPVISNYGVGDTAEIIEKYGSGIVIKDQYYDKYIKIISEGVSFDNKGIRQGAINFFSLNNGVEKYNDLFKACIPGIYE